MNLGRELQTNLNAILRKFPHIYAGFLVLMIGIYGYFGISSLTAEVELSSGLYLKPVSFDRSQIALYNKEGKVVAGPNIDSIAATENTVYGWVFLNKDSHYPPTYFIYSDDLGYARYYWSEKEFEETLAKEGLPPFVENEAEKYFTLLKAERGR